MKKTTQNKMFVSTALVGALLSSGTAIKAKMHGDSAKETKKVRCKGVAVKAGNDCGVKGGHSCSGKAQSHFDSKEWIYLTPKDCKAVTEALKNPAVKSYVEQVYNKAEAKTKRMKMKKMKMKKGS